MIRSASFRLVMMGRVICRMTDHEMTKPNTTAIAADRGCQRIVGCLIFGIELFLRVKRSLAILSL